MKTVTFGLLAAVFALLLDKFAHVQMWNECICVGWFWFLIGAGAVIEVWESK